MNAIFKYASKEVNEEFKSQILSEKPLYLCHVKGRQGILPFPSAFLDVLSFGRKVVDLGLGACALCIEREKASDSEFPTLITFIDGEVSLKEWDYAFGDFIITGEIDFNGDPKPLNKAQIANLEKSLLLGTLDGQPTVMINFDIQ